MVLWMVAVSRYSSHRRDQQLAWEAEVRQTLYGDTPLMIEIHGARPMETREKIEHIASVLVLGVLFLLPWVVWAQAGSAQ